MRVGSIATRKLSLIRRPRSLFDGGEWAAGHLPHDIHCFEPAAPSFMTIEVNRLCGHTSSTHEEDR